MTAGNAATHIRPFAPEDLPRLLQLARDCFGSSAWGENHFAPHPGRMVWVADTDGQPSAGYCVVECVADEAELQAVAVAKEYRRQGTGRALLLAAQESARQSGAQQIYLEVRASNLAAQAFYRRIGFEASGTRPAYYRDPPEAAVLMRSAL